MFPLLLWSIPKQTHALVPLLIHVVQDHKHQVKPRQQGIWQVDVLCDLQKQADESFNPMLSEGLRLPQAELFGNLQELAAGSEAIATDGEQDRDSRNLPDGQAGLSNTADLT